MYKLCMTLSAIPITNTLHGSKWFEMVQNAFLTSDFSRGYCSEIIIATLLPCFLTTSDISIIQRSAT